MRLKRQGVSWESLVIKVIKVIKVPKRTDCLLADLCEWDPLGWPRNLSGLSMCWWTTYRLENLVVLSATSFEVAKEKVNHMKGICSHYGQPCLLWFGYDVCPTGSWVKGSVSN